LLGFRHRLLGGQVHAVLQLLDLRTHAEHLQHPRGLADVARQLDTHVRIAAETARATELLHGDLGALAQGILEAGAGVALGQVGK